LYVEAARSLGARPSEILFKYIFPNVLPSVTIIFSVNVADAILTEAGLSFIGLGLPPDTPDWGIDLSRGKDYLQRAWWLITFPGIMVTLVTLSFSMRARAYLKFSILVWRSCNMERELLAKVQDLSVTYHTRLGRLARSIMSPSIFIKGRF
jgi:peptide/nickel transport system permease protein